MRTLFTLLLVALAYMMISLVSMRSVFMETQVKAWLEVDTTKSHVTAAKRAPLVNKTIIAPKLVVPQFSEYGTREFTEKCAWAVASPSEERNCTMMVRPDADDREGISLWVSLIAQAHQLAQQAHCNLVFDYGKDINVSSILTPTSAWNWIVPEGFDCQQQSSCYLWKSPSRLPRVSVETIAREQNKSVASVPLYRYAYNLRSSHLRVHRDDFAGIQSNIPSFGEPSVGYACSLTSLFRLSPDSSQYVPNLFTKLLPAMHNADSLVLSLYIRTKQADKSVEKEKEKHANPFVEESDYRDLAKDIIKCALHQEQVYLRNSTLSNVVWMVVTDSKDLKQWIADTYSNETRQVLITDSRGAHSRPDHGVSPANFGEAMIDWYLIGEADIVVMDRTSVSFGSTAALRTARPVYDASKGKCQRAIPIHGGHNTYNIL